MLPLYLRHHPSQLIGQALIDIPEELERAKAHLGCGQFIKLRLVLIPCLITGGG
ncbi:ABC-type spermidine/putrescine transport system permease subunit I [Rhizobium flavum]|uniref:ABC-type spermidine/putrescine transport system permease subunit I n=1 Tax=Pseudorhizobium flavum TaxID=1335061 RepID=A0A7W9Z0S4_9HYPH|nr:ABC-type spermidine/putrescine transport system permease subunit I [Pseudorhizobium flavum]CAD6628700.1 hypothetical protein RFYW14_04017 [Pseudorhizobium flavum]